MFMTVHYRVHWTRIQYIVYTSVFPICNSLGPVPRLEWANGVDSAGEDRGCFVKAWHKSGLTLCTVWLKNSPEGVNRREMATSFLFFFFLGGAGVLFSSLFWSDRSKWRFTTGIFLTIVGHLDSFLGREKNSLKVFTMLPWFNVIF